MLTMTNPVVILIPPSSNPLILSSSLPSFIVTLCLFPHLFLHPSPCSFFYQLLLLSLGRLLFRGAPPLNLGTHIPMLPTEACVCACALWPKRRGGSLRSPQLKGRGITGTQTLIKAFQPPMAPLIQS